MGSVPCTVIVPTIGRPELLRDALVSLAACEPRAEEIVVVNDGAVREVDEVVAQFSGAGASVVPGGAVNLARAWNEGLRHASHDLVLITDDDCSVAADWVAVAAAEMATDGDGIITGRVLPLGDPAHVPSTKADDGPRDYTGEPIDNALFTGNMACSRRAVLEFGGFDERIVPTAADNDFGYRWLSAGRSLRYVPALTVWHRDWRTPAQMRALYVDYAHGQGVFYAKHLRGGDLRMLRYIGRDLRHGLAARWSARRNGRYPWWDWRLGILKGLPRGLYQGWRGTRP